MVRVRFGGQRVNGIIWKRADTSATPESSIRYIERVVTDRVLVPESMRDDMTRIADAFGGTRANILRLAVPPRGKSRKPARASAIAMPQETAAGKQRLAAVDQEIYGQLQRQYGNINLLHDALQGRRFQSFVFDLLPVPTIGGAARHGWWPRRSLRTSRRCWCCRPCGRSPT